jgi:hypothetical protein
MLIFSAVSFRIIRNIITKVEINRKHLCWHIISILKGFKASGTCGSWVAWFHEKLQLDSFCLIPVSRINLVHIIHLKNKRNGCYRAKKEAKAVDDLENLLMTIVQIDLAQQ